MTLADLTKLMHGNEKVTLEYKAENIFSDTVDALYNEDIRYKGEDICSSFFLEKQVGHLYQSSIYNSIYIEIED